mmetsp:Transcript_13854/g.20969  ORF Transcript_13854/g.20969 Transcript_13854/m.20969 type:complete len:153 (+) Transcript_13854:98-556(+)
MNALSLSILCILLGIIYGLQKEQVIGQTIFKGEMEDIDYEQIDMGDPVNINKIEPYEPHYYYFEVPKGYVSASVKMQCAQDCDIGTTQINVTTAKNNITEPLWSENANTKIPTVMMTPFTEPPFQPGTFYISIRAEYELIDAAVLTVQAEEN